MRKKSLIILLVSLLIIFSLFSIVASVNAAYDEAWDEGYYYESHKSWFTYHYFNGTIVDKDAVYPMNYIEYLINVNGTTFFLQTDTRETPEFYIGDKVTIYGSAVNEERNMHRMSFSEFNGKYWSSDYNSTKKFPRIRVYNEMRLADGFVRGGSSSSLSSSSSSSDKGISFSESKQYFPEASTTVREHVFDEADRNGDGYLSKSEYKIFKDVKRFTKDYANVKNNEYVETPDLWNGDGTTRTRYCADHGRVAVKNDNKCPWCKKYRHDPRTRADSTRYV